MSQFILDPTEHAGFFRQIAGQLRPDGILASADLSADLSADSYDTLLGRWQQVMTGSDTSTEGLRHLKTAYANDVAVIAPAAVASIIQAGGFDAPVPFFQAGLIHAWVAKRASSKAA